MRHAVDIRRRELTLTTMTDVPVGQVIGQDHNDIGLRARHRLSHFAAPVHPEYPRSYASYVRDTTLA